MTLIPRWPGPLCTARFRAGPEGWSIVDEAQAGAPRAPAWAAITDPAGADFSGLCRYSPAATEAGWYFRSPAGFLPGGGALTGGTIAFAIAVTAPPPLAAPVIAPAPSGFDLVLSTTGLKLGVPAGTIARFASAGPLPGQHIVVVPLASGAGWRN